VRHRKLLLLIWCGILGSFIFASYKGLKLLKTSRLILNAKELEQGESFKEAEELLRTARAETPTTNKNLRKQLQDKASALEKLAAEKAIYEKGVTLAAEDSWKTATATWEKLPENSRYTAKITETKEIPHAKPTGELVQITNYKHAKDPTWEEVVQFLEKDVTDDKLYDPTNYVCTGFAETLHNNAEKNGIKAAYVGIDFEAPPGHAITAFNTTDKGLIYIDNTGEGHSELRDTFLDTEQCEWDKVAYVEKGEGFGVISINYPELNPTEYAVYENYATSWEDVQSTYAQVETEIQEYNEKVTEYEKRVEVFDEKRDALDKMASAYNSEVKRINEETQKTSQARIEEYNRELELWESGRDDYQEEITEYNSDVEKYNESGEGDIEDLNDRAEKLNKRLDELNNDLENLQKKGEELNKETADAAKEAVEKLEEEKTKVDEASKELEKLSDLLEARSEDLELTQQAFDGQMKNLKEKEEYLGTCYWKSLGVVTKVEIFW
jgi:hypothetical protein